MLAWKKTQRFLTLALALALLLCCVPALGLQVQAADTEMYLYNGVELPDINVVWDEYRTSYPYSYIMRYADGDYSLLLMNNWAYYSKNYSGSNDIGRSSGVLWRSYSLQNGEWVLLYAPTTASGLWFCDLDGGDTLVWTSYDVKNGQEVILAASAPVPVNPPSSISSVSFVSLETVQAGLYIVVSVDVAGTGDFDSSATLTLSGNTSSGTYLEKGDVGNNWTLFCGSDETASTLTLTSASVQDPSVSATYQVSVESSADPSTPTTPEGEEPIPTEENPTEPGEDVGGDSSDNEKDEATDEGNQGVGDLTDAIPDYSEGFMNALQDFTSAMSYTGTEAKLKIPAVMVPSLGDLVPGFQMMEEMELDFGAYVRMMPSGLMTLAQSLLTIALIVYCFKELYDTISYFLTLKGGSA